MKLNPKVRAHFLLCAFLPRTRTTDRRAEWHLRQFRQSTQDDPEPRAKRPLWPLALAALSIWSAIACAVWFLVHTWSA